MSYLQQGNRRRAGRKLYGTLLVSAALIIILAATGLLANLLYFLGEPLLKLRTATVQSVGDEFSYLASKKKLRQENQRLKEELDILLLIKSENEVLRNENQSLREILGRESETRFSVAKVISKPPIAPYDTLIIDLGDSDEVERGDAVFAPGSFYLGEIDEVFSGSSKVVLASNPGSNVGVEIERSGLPGEAVGKGGGNFEMKLPSGVDIEKGDKILMPEKGLALLGIVEEIDDNPRNTFQIVQFKVPVNLSEIKWVEIRGL